MMTRSLRPIRSRYEVNTIRRDIEDLYDGFFAGRGQVDWEEFLDRLEARGYDVGEQMDSPVVRRIQRIVRELRQQEGE